MSFECSSEERALVFRTLVESTGKTELWNDNEPSQRALQLFEDIEKGKGLPWSPSEQFLFRLAWIIWNVPMAGPALDFAQIFRLDRKNQTMVGELLVALAQGTGLKGWAAKNMRS